MGRPLNRKALVAGLIIGMGVIAFVIVFARTSQPEAKPVAEAAAACLNEDGHHNGLVAYATELLGDEITIDRTSLSPVIDPERRDVRVRMVFSHPNRKAMRMLGRLDVDTCGVFLLYPQQFEDPLYTCRLMTYFGDYGVCDFDDDRICRCEP